MFPRSLIFIFFPYTTLFRSLINFKWLLLLRFLFLELGFFSLFFLICLFVTDFPYFFWDCFTASLYFLDSGLSFPCLLFNTALRTKNMIKVIPNRINKLVISCPGFLINCAPKPTTTKPIKKYNSNERDLRINVSSFQYYPNFLNEII